LASSRKVVDGFRRPIDGDINIQRPAGGEPIGYRHL
jgi:hypothetical protein